MSQASGLHGASPDATCTCPSGGGSLRHPCPAHPASVELAGVAAKLTFINGGPAMCGCQVEYSSGGGEYSDVIYVTLCAKHSGSAILDLVATNRIALTPEYEGQWHADLYLDREIPLAKAEGATPAEAVLALMSAERIDPEQGGVDQAGGDRWDALQSIMEWTAAENIPDDRKLCLIRNAARAALAQPSPVRSSLLINGYQLRAALEFIAPDGTAKQLESEARIEWRQQDADFLEAGLYAWCAEYPEEGCVLLDEEPATAQPSPAQAEQAEAERPELWAVHAQGPDELYAAFTREDAEKHAAELNALPMPEGIAVGAVVAPSPWPEAEHWKYLAEQERDHKNEIAVRLRQFERICEGLPQDAIDGGWTVQGIRAHSKQLEEQLKSALARVAELTATRNRYGVDAHYFNKNLQRILRNFESFTPDEPARSLIILAKVADEKVVAQAQHSVPEGWMLVPVEQLLNMMSDKDHDTRIMAERQLLAVLAAAPGKEVGHE
ncbi:hypothetical protein IPC782_00135 [Pseudomonas aeruginosa]|nr:hypothetical protein IPC782_00135 [Pseudomonas aeruginosa]